MKKKIRKRQQTSITVKILGIIILLVIPLNIISIFSTTELFDRYSKQIELSLKNITDVYMNTLDFSTEKADLYLYELCSNNEECAVLKKNNADLFEYENAKYRCHNLLSEKVSQEEVISGYFLISEAHSEDCILALNSYISASSALTEYITCQQHSTNRWELVTIGDRQLLIRLAYEKGLFYGALVDLDRQCEEILEQTAYQTKKVSFSRNRISYEKNEIAASSSSGRMDIVLNLKISKSECYSGLPSTNLIFAAAAFLMIIAVPLIYFYMRREIVYPLQELNKGFFEIKKGNRTYTIEKSASSPEFQEAYHSFNEMASGMENLRIDNIEKELEKNKLELDNLKLQIRPHFLLNTFNLMYCLLKTQDGTTAARRLILYLSDYFRYLFRSDKDVELFDRELSLIEKYIEVTRIRYPNGITISYDIDPEVCLVRVPPLLIHNFVENVVRHALSPEKCVHVVLAARYENGWVRFEISDDGKGMTHDLVDCINNCRWEDEAAGHLGIQNSMRRIEYIYGKTASVTVESELDVGTTFTILIPYKLEEE